MRASGEVRKRGGTTDSRTRELMEGVGKGSAQAWASYRELAHPDSGVAVR